MKIVIETTAIVDYPSDVLVVFAFESEELAGATREVDQRFDGALKRAIESKEFQGQWLEHWSSLSLGHLSAQRIVVLGLGRRDEFNSSRLRQVMGDIAQWVNKSGGSTVALDLEGMPVEPEPMGEAVVEGLELGAWTFQGYHQKDGDEKVGMKTVIVQLGSDGRAKFERGIGRGQSLASAQNLVRKLGWTPSNYLYPEKLAEIAQEEAEKHGLEVEIFDENRLLKLKMGALLGVGQGSTFPPRLVVLRYRGGNTKTLALVGKGITFDSGGISLKPPANMDEMKYDMLGAAAVLGAMCAIAEQKPGLDVIGIMAIAQNMPSGSAYKPGDVVTAFNGKTIEVTNTDAEGRVVLADGVSYAVHLGADYIVEASTLTGAALVVLGHEATAMVATDDALAEIVMRASQDAGERVWQLPIYPEYQDLYKSDIADMKNAPGRDAGTITGGMIIAEFADPVPFVHLDIAGTAWTSKGPLNAKGGATGVMVRTMARLPEYLI